MTISTLLIADSCHSLSVHMTSEHLDNVYGGNLAEPHAEEPSLKLLRPPHHHA